MANTKRFQVKHGLRTKDIEFTDNSGASNEIIASFIDATDTLSFSGNSGQLFAITDSITGSIFTVNDISGMPSIEVKDTGDIILAETAGNVGIGTNTPTELLHVAGTNGAIVIDADGISNTASLKFINDNERSRITSNYDSVAGGGGQLGFWTDTIGGTLTRRMTIDSAGNVGIGTTSPTEELTVGSGGSNYIGIGGDGVNASGIRFYRGASTVDGLIEIDANEDMIISMDNTGSLGTGQILFKTGNTERLRIDSSGNVGIGTSSVDSLLHLSASSGPELRIENTDAALTEGQVVGSVVFEQNDDSTSGTGITGRIQMRSSARPDNGSYFGNAADMDFLVSGSSSGAASDNASKTAMTIRAGTGNVGINESAPTYPLQVTTGSPATGKWRLNTYGGMHFHNLTDANNERYIHGRSDGALSIGYVPIANLQVGGTAGEAYDQVHITSNGAVGIGVIPENWDSTFDVLRVGRTASLFSYDPVQGADGTWLGSNAWYSDVSNDYRYITSDPAELYVQIDGTHIWSQAAAGTAGETTTVTSGLRYEITSAPTPSLVPVGAANDNVGTIFTATGNETLTVGGVTQLIDFVEHMRLDASGSVGIGTASPQNVLDIGQSSSGRAITWEGYNNVWGEYSGGGLHLASNYYGNTTGNTYLTSTTNTFGAAGIRISGTSGSNNGGEISFYVDPETAKTAGAAFTPTERMVITKDGNVGIGTPTPSAALSIFRETNTSGTANGTTLLTLTNDVGTDLNQQKTFVDFIFLDDNGNEFPQVRIGAEVGPNANADGNELEGEGAFVVYTNNATGSGPAPTGLTERMRVDYQGNVGIGTPTPAVLLHTLRTSTTAYNAASTTNDTTALFQNEGAAGHSTIQLQTVSSGTANTGQATISAFNKATSSKDTILSFGVRRESDDAVYEAMRIDGETGNVGIGTTSPVNSLQLAESAYASVPAAGATGHMFAFGSSDYGLVGGALLSGASYLQSTRWDATATNYDLLLQPNGGNVGIGTSSPTNKFEVAGTQGQLFSVADSFTGTIFSVNDGSGVPSVEVMDTGDIYLAEFGGNVGIGTSAPARPLEISFASETFGLRLTRNDAVGNSLLEFANTSGVQNYIGHDAGLNAFVINNDGTNTVVVTDSGNVGIGLLSASPTHKLEIRNDVPAPTDLDPTAIKLFNNDDGGSAIEFSNGVAGKSKISFGVEGTGSSTDYTYIGFSTSANGGALSEAMRITSAGNVGIGTLANVDEILHVEKTSGTTLVKTEVASNSIVGFEIAKTNATTQSWRIVDGQTVNGVLEFHDLTNNATRMAIDGTGDVGIGTTTPTRKLDVNGYATATGFIAKNTAGVTDGASQFISRANVDNNTWMVGVAPAADVQGSVDNVTWGLFWAGDGTTGSNPPAFGTSGTHASNNGPGNIWGNATNQNEFVFVGSNQSAWIVQGSSGHTWQRGDLWVGGTYYRGGQEFLAIQDAAPTGVDGNLWWESDTGKLKIYYNDGNTSQWVDAVPIPDTSTLYSKAGGTITGAVNINSSLTTTGSAFIGGDVYANYSDSRLKNFTGTIESSLDKVKSLSGYLFTENEVAKQHGFDNDAQQVGVSAQEVQAVLPEAVALAPFDRDEETGASKSGENYLTVQYEKLVPLLIEAIKEQSATIEALTKRLEKLEG